MNISSIIAWILSNTGLITQVISTIETIATDLQSLHGNNSLDAYVKAILAAIESFFQRLGANTTPSPAEATTIMNSLSVTGPTPSIASNPSGSAP